MDIAQLSPPRMTAKARAKAIPKVVGEDRHGAITLGATTSGLITTIGAIHGKVMERDGPIKTKAIAKARATACTALTGLGRNHSMMT